MEETRIIMIMIWIISAIGFLILNSFVVGTTGLCGIMILFIEGTFRNFYNDIKE